MWPQAAFGGFAAPAAPADPKAEELKRQLEEFFEAFGIPSTQTVPPKQAGDPSVILKSRFKVR